MICDAAGKKFGGQLSEIPLVHLTEFQKMNSAFVEDVNPGIQFFRRLACACAGFGLFFAPAKRFQSPSDLRVHEPPENAFEFFLIGFDPLIAEALFNRFLNIKGISAGVDDIPAGIGAQFQQIPAQIIFPLAVGFPDEKVSPAPDFFLGQIHNRTSRSESAEFLAFAALSGWRLVGISFQPHGGCQV